MNRRTLLSGASLTLLCLLGGPVGAQTPTSPDLRPMMQMGEPAPPQPGDAAMTCEQIAKEMQSIFKKKNVRPNPQGTQAACELQRSMTITPAEQAALSNPSPQAAALQQQRVAQMQAATQSAMSANAGVMQAMNDPRLMRLAILADEKHCVFEEHEPPAQAPAADTCGSGVVTPAIVTGGVAPPAPASNGDPFRPAAKATGTAPAVTPAASPAPKPAAGDPFVKQGSSAPPPKQPTGDPFKN